MCGSTAGTVPPVLAAATVAVEDRRFWHHVGVDPLAILRALRVNLAEGRVVEGGSTITQQVAKHLLQRHEPARARGLAAKLHEAVIALRLEHRFTKADLLAMYLNLAPYGNQIAGVERASRAYFGVPAAMATPAQAAFLAGLPQRPSAFNPYRRREAAHRAPAAGAQAHGARRRAVGRGSRPGAGRCDRAQSAAPRIVRRRTSSRWCWPAPASLGPSAS